MIRLPVSFIQGILGERIFEHFDSDSDGCLTEEDFFAIHQKFCKSSLQAIAFEIFIICDLKQDNLIDKEEFLMTVNPI